MVAGWTRSEAQAFDCQAQEKLGLSSLILMENAGRSVAEIAITMGKSFAVVCGVGNNGGDGLVAARHLLNAGCKVQVFLIGDPQKLKPDPKINYSILQKMGQKIETDLPQQIEADLIVDAIFGIGLETEVRASEQQIIRAINKSGKPVLAVDIPSGLDVDTGEVLGVAIKATKTVTFLAPKIGFALAQGPEYCGEVIVRDIGITD
ncbi:MAG: NAD(P)H-hydrate epimerase [bacterium]